MAETNLPPCPFCAEDKLIVQRNVIMQRPDVSCLTCGASVPAPNDDPTREGAVKAWSLRAPI
jgi:endogenous inhibitor of DNA gyrase (YacG/DUF329 family)